MKSIPKSEEEWKKKLTPEQYSVLREKELKCRLPENMCITKAMALIIALRAARNCSLPARSLIQAPAGQASMSRKTGKMSS